MRNKKSGFSMIELLVSMAIIAVLLGLVGFGIATAQRNSRDSQRRQSLGDVRLGLEDYLTRYNRYPKIDEFVLERKQDSTGTIILRNASTDAITVPLKGPAVPKEGSTEATTNSSPYCFALPQSGGGYLLSVKLENGEWFDQSSTISGTETCETPL